MDTWCPQGGVVGMKPGQDRARVQTSCTLPHKPPPASAPTVRRRTRRRVRADPWTGIGAGLMGISRRSGVR